MAFTNSSVRTNFLTQIQKIRIKEHVVLFTFKSTSAEIKKLHPSTYDLCLFLDWVKKRTIDFQNATISLAYDNKVDNPDYLNQQLYMLELSFNNFHDSLNHLEFSETSTMYSGFETFGKRKLETLQMSNKLYVNVEQFAHDSKLVRVRFVGIINKFSKLSSLCFTSMGHDEILLMSISPKLLNRLTTLHLESLWESTAMSLLALSYLADNCRCVKSFRLICQYTPNPSDHFCVPEIHLVNLLECMSCLETFALKCRGYFTDITLDTILQRNISLHTIKLGMTCRATNTEKLVLLTERIRLVHLEFGFHPAIRYYESDDTPNFIYHNNGGEKHLTLMNSTSDPNIREQNSFLSYDQFDKFFRFLNDFTVLSLHGIFNGTILKHIAANNHRLRTLQLCTIKNKRIVLTEQELKLVRTYCCLVVIV
jgi:hypothetical protein